MKQKLSDWIARYKCIDWGILYLRMVLGTSILFHNIGKIQNYNEIINSYPSLFFINQAASFVLITVVEVLIAVLLIFGLGVRISAAIMIVGVLWAAFSLGFPAGELEFVYAAVYIFLLIAGGGFYSFDSAIKPRKVKKADK